jgi:general secretion pathway protein H
MPTSATGPSSSARPAQRGFTLIEIMVVVLIIGIMVAGTVISIGVAHGDREIENQRDRILAVTDFVREQAALQNREFGIRCFRGGYEFLVYDGDTGLWMRAESERLTSVQKLPEGLSLELSVEGRRIVLPAEEALPDELAPQVLLYSSGEITLFELKLQRDATGTGVSIAPSAVEDRIEAKALPAAAA